MAVKEPSTEVFACIAKEMVRDLLCACEVGETFTKSVFIAVEKVSYTVIVRVVLEWRVRGGADL